MSCESAVIPHVSQKLPSSKSFRSTTTGTLQSNAFHDIVSSNWWGLAGVSCNWNGLSHRSQVPASISRIWGFLLPERHSQSCLHLWICRLAPSCRVLALSEPPSLSVASVCSSLLHFSLMQGPQPYDVCSFGWFWDRRRWFHVPSMSNKPHKARGFHSNCSRSLCCWLLQRCKALRLLVACCIVGTISL